MQVVRSILETYPHLFTQTVAKVRKNGKNTASLGIRVNKFFLIFIIMYIVIVIEF